MAMMIRDLNKLLTLQLQLSAHDFPTAPTYAMREATAQPRVEVVSSTLFSGPEPIGGMMELPALEFGLPSGADKEAFASTRLRLPEALIAPLRAASNKLLPPGVPLWLYIPRGAAKLALFPWEAEVWRALGRPLLRLPNFLDDPFDAGATLEIALAISLLPECDVLPATEHVKAFFAALEGPIPPHRDVVVHIFADAGCEDQVAHLAGPAGAGPLRIEIHPARTAEEASAASTSAAVRKPFGSPWLAWMARRLECKAIDLVHFICPAYYTETCSCLALQQTRLAGRYPLWKRLVVVEDVCALLDQLGAKSVSFAAAGPGLYERSVSRVAFDVSWRRPGPVIALPAEPDRNGSPRRCA